jgi:hypothetical protein
VHFQLQLWSTFFRGKVTPECQRLADEKRLSTTAKAAFIRKCVADRSGDPLALCERAAAQRNLRGAERNSGIERCMVEAKKRT